MASIPSETNPELAKYTAEHMLLVERHGRFTGKSCGEILIDEWSTSGKIRPTSEVLLDLLIKCELFRAADFVAIEVLLFSEPPQRPVAGPAAKIPSFTEEFNENGGSLITRSTILETDGPKNNRDHLKEILEQINNQDSESGNLINFSAAGLESAMQGFPDSCKVGCGAFGEVYKLDLSKRGGPVLAVKSLHPSPSLSMVEEQFLTEIRVLSAYRHENLVPLIGFCASAPRFCLVYEFMSGGSLLKAIACEVSSNLQKIDEPNQNLSFAVV